MERKKRTRKGATQTAQSIKIDNELLEWLNNQPCKGRYINELIRADMEANGGKPVIVWAKTLPAAKPRGIDGEAAMAAYMKAKRDYPDYVALFEYGDKYDALFEDARRVKSIIRDARIGTAETNRGAKKLPGCIIATISKEAAELLRGRGIGFVTLKYETV